jgi:hypothetical protein
MKFSRIKGHTTRMEGLVIHRNPASPEVLEQRRARIAQLSAASFKMPQLKHCKSVQEYRDMRENGTNGFPKPWLYEGAKTIEARARDGYKIPLRAINPTNAKRGFALHYHSGTFMTVNLRAQERLIRHDRRICNRFSQVPRCILGRHCKTHGYDDYQR